MPFITCDAKGAQFFSLFFRRSIARETCANAALASSCRICLALKIPSSAAFCAARKSCCER